MPWVCLRFVIVIFPDHTHFLFLISGFGCCPFLGGGSVAVGLLFNVLPIVYGSCSVFVFVLLCITLCPF